MILRTYRRLNHLSQEKLALLLGYDKTYISMIETRRRTISEVVTLRHIAHRLGVPVHVLGVTEVDDATFSAMMQFADSLLALAEVARQAGRAADAVNELWPLVARLEARAAEGFVDRESLTLLGRARSSLGIALGALLPEERLATAARWTGQALIAAQRLEEPNFLAYALTMHGNELRKAGHVGAAIERLRRAIALHPDRGVLTAALAFLARAAGEAGHTNLFDSTIISYRRQLDEDENVEMLGNQFTFHEIQLRGLLATGRVAEAVRLLDGLSSSRYAAAPQWTVIDQVTTGSILLASGDREGGADILHTALSGAERYRLPHQVQRVIRLTDHVDTLGEAGRAVLTRLETRLGDPGF